MEIVYISFIIILLSLQNVYPQNSKNWTVKIGMNRSEFTEIKNEAIKTFTFGVEKRINITNHFSIAPEIIFSKQGGTLRMVTIKYPDDQTWINTIYYEDLFITTNCMDMSLILNFALLKTEDFNFSLRAFPSWHFGFVNIEKDLRRIKKVSPSELEDFDYDFIYTENDNMFESRESLCLNYGISVSIQRVLFEFRYSQDMEYLGNTSELGAIKYKIHSFYFLFGINF